MLVSTRLSRRDAMIKVSVMYPGRPGARFDHDYYRDKHLPLIKSRMGAALKYYGVDKGLAGGSPDAPPPYVGMCHLLCDSVEAYRSSFGPHSQELLADIANFTDVTPVTRSARWWWRTRPKARTRRFVDVLVAQPPTPAIASETKVFATPSSDCWGSATLL
jgi:uncharacterized protein (TIGR02118 family)